MKPIFITTIWIMILQIISGCTLFDPSPRTAAEGEMPGQYTLAGAETERPDRWWQELDDPQLNGLMDQAFSENFSLKEAWARLRQARALTIQAGAARYPDLGLNAGAAAYRNRTDTGSSAATVNTEEYSLGLASSYEIDLWGKIRSEQQAARLTETATREDVNAAAMTLAANVVNRWADVISQRMQKALLQKQLKVNRTYLDLIDLRFRKGMVSALDVYQQKQVVEEVQSKIPLVETQEQLALNELALLLGKPPGTPVTISRKDLPIPKSLPKTGIPADLLEKRPDIRAAMLRLEATDWQVAAARANRLPSINLTGSAAYGADKLDLIFDNWLLMLAGDLTAPLMDGGRRAAEVDRQKALADERLWAYRRSVYTAVQEVEDALITETKRREHIQALQRQRKTAERAREQAVERYRRGLSDYLPVLTQLLSVQSLDRTLVQQRTELLNDRIRLYRALGGTWTRNLKDTSVYIAPPVTVE